MSLCRVQYLTNHRWPTFWYGFRLSRSRWCRLLPPLVLSPWCMLLAVKSIPVKKTTEVKQYSVKQFISAQYQKNLLTMSQRDFSVRTVYGSAWKQFWWENKWWTRIYRLCEYSRTDFTQNLKQTLNRVMDRKPLLAGVIMHRFDCI